jgi:predicted membrane GTPase involved in stress response
MNFDLPIEQLVRRTDTRFQLGFAIEAKERVPLRDEFVLSASHKGLHVLGRNEDSLSAPIEALRRAYGPSLVMDEPQVRLIEGVQVQEPIMHVRISLETAYQGAVKRALLVRGATATEERVSSRFAVLRYEAPLARLIGLPAEIKRLTSGTARYWIVLSHYALVMRGPGGRAA